MRDTYRKVPAEKANATGSSEWLSSVPTKQIIAMRKVAIGVVQEKRAMYGVAMDYRLRHNMYISSHLDRAS